MVERTVWRENGNKLLHLCWKCQLAWALNAIFVIALQNTLRYFLSEVSKRDRYCSSDGGGGGGGKYLKERHRNRIYVSVSLWKM